jgi:hypothetical protein
VGGAEVGDNLASAVCQLEPVERALGARSVPEGLATGVGDGKIVDCQVADTVDHAVVGEHIGESVTLIASQAPSVGSVVGLALIGNRHADAIAVLVPPTGALLAG